MENTCMESLLRFHALKFLSHHEERIGVQHVDRVKHLVCPKNRFAQDEISLNRVGREGCASRSHYEGDVFFSNDKSLPHFVLELLVPILHFLVLRSISQKLRQHRFKWDRLEGAEDLLVLR